MSITQRISTLERTIRATARAALAAEIGASFEPALQAANDPEIEQRLKAVKADIIKARRAGTENKALEEFLQRAAPTVSILDSLRPQMFRIGADGKRLADDDVGEHIAVLIPHYTNTQDLLIDARAPTKCESFKDAEKKVAEIELLGGKITLLDDLQWSLIIDRRFRNPSVNPKYFPKSPTDRWYYTSTPLTAETGKSPSGYVWAVDLHYGHVSSVGPASGGFVRGGRLVPASQF